MDITPFVESIENEISYAAKELVRDEDRVEFARKVAELMSGYFPAPLRESKPPGKHPPSRRFARGGI